MPETVITEINFPPLFFQTLNGFCLTVSLGGKGSFFNFDLTKRRRLSLCLLLTGKRTDFQAGDIILLKGDKGYFTVRKSKKGIM